MNQFAKFYPNNEQFITATYCCFCFVLFFQKIYYHMKNNLSSYVVRLLKSALVLLLETLEVKNNAINLPAKYFVYLLRQVQLGEPEQYST